MTDDCDMVGDSPSKGGYDIPMDVCGLCDLEDTLANLCCEKKGMKLHQRCFNAIRAHDAFVEKGAPEQVKEKMENEFHNDRKGWKTRVLPWVEPEKRDVARTDTKAKFMSIQDTISKETKKDLNDDLTLNLVQFQAFHGFWNRMSDPDSLKLFWKTHKEQKGIADIMENGQRIAQVKQTDIARTRHSKGVSTVDSMAKMTPVDENTFESKRRRLTGKTKFAGAQHETSSSSDDDKKSNKSSGRRSIVDINIDDQTRERKLPTQSEINDCDPVRFMMMKTMWRKMSDHVSKGFQDPSTGYIKQLRQASEGVSQTQERDLPLPTATLITNLTTMYQDLDQETDKVKPANKATFLKVVTDIDEKMKKLENQLSGLKFINDESKDKNRKEYMNHYNKSVNIQKRLIKGQFAKEVANIWSRSLYAGVGEEQKAAMLGGVADASQKDKAKGGRKVKPLMLQCQPTLNSDPIDFEKVGTWTDGALFGAVKKYMATIKEVIDSKIEGVVQAFDQRGSNWMGCLGRLNVSPPEEHALDVLGDGYFELGAKEWVPWLCTVRADAFRCGPSAFPLNGYSSLVISLTDNMYFVLLPAASIINQGIILADAPKFLASDGATSTLERGYLVKAKIHEILYVPYGVIVLPLFYPQSRDSNQKNELGHCMVLPLLHQQRMKAAPTSLTTAISSTNLSFLTSQPQQMYKDRASGLRKFHAD
ncbi:unnamed protein product [Prorocentrum cordatum]|uniref:Uncharacterized protein n=1 Tax=Prorocentrum cordatum TaxID=2364126 RepID=A0ABN9S2X0_9DINO|nr:unnamed protein product [Polarella glacialis]